MLPIKSNSNVKKCKTTNIIYTCAIIIWLSKYSDRLKIHFKKIKNVIIIPLIKTKFLT